MGRLAWVTGGSSGIGRAVVERLVRDGWRVAASARDAAALTALAAAFPGAVYGFAVDIADAQAVTDTVAAIEAAHGPIDCAILAAGTHIPVTLADFSVAPFRRLVEVNIMGSVHCLAALLPGMRARGAGQIALVSSVAGYSGLPTASAYGASKAALINLAEALKLDCDGSGIDIRLVDPGFVRTPLTDKNAFPMPFLMEADVAADRLVRGLAGKGFEIIFPRRFAILLKLLRILPYALYFPVVRRMTKGQ